MKMRDTRTKHEFDCTELGIFAETAVEQGKDGCTEHNLDNIEVWHPQFNTWTSFWLAVDTFVRVLYYNPKLEFREEASQ